MTQCTRAVVGDQAILYRCARDLPLPDVCISTPPFVATKFSISPLTYSVSPKNMSTNQAIACIGCVGRSACFVSFFRESASGSPAVKFNLLGGENLETVQYRRLRSESSPAPAEIRDVVGQAILKKGSPHTRLQSVRFRS